MPDRHSLLRRVAADILDLPSSPVLRVGVDGVDGAGKTRFADELAGVLDGSGRPIIRASTDSFHNPRAIRYRRGRASPLGYFQDSFDYPLLKRILLDPLSPGGSLRYRAAAFDHVTDSPVEAPEQAAAPGSILIFDGIFIHRPELRGYWDYSIFLEVGFPVSVARCALRDGAPPEPEAPANRRYVEGQKLYLRECEPARHATVVINNESLASPFFVTRRDPRAPTLPERTGPR